MRIQIMSYHEKEIERLNKWLDWCEAISKKIVKINGEEIRLNTFRQKQWIECLLDWHQKRLSNDKNG